MVSESSDCRVLLMNIFTCLDFSNGTAAEFNNSDIAFGLVWVLLFSCKESNLSKMMIEFMFSPGIICWCYGYC